MVLALSKIEHHSIGSLRGVTATLTFDSSYLTNGEALVARDLGLGQLLMVSIVQGEDGFVFEWDSANNKILARRVGSSVPTFTGTAEPPTLIVEESVTVTADVGTLAFVPVYILGITDGASQAYNIVPTGETPVDNVSVAVNWVTGAMTFAAADDPATVQVTYFPHKAGSFFDSANLVVDEAVTGTDGTGYVNLANRAAAFQYIYDTTAPQLLLPSPVGEAPGDNQFELDIWDGTNSKVKNHSGENASALKTTYLKHSELQSGVQFVDDADISLTSGDYNWTEAADRGMLVVPGMGHQIVGEETGAGNETAILGGPSTTEANLLARWAPHLNVLATANSSAFVTTAISWLIIDEMLLEGRTPAGTVADAAAALAEVSSGVNLSAAVVEIFAIGR